MSHNFNTINKILTPSNKRKPNPFHYYLQKISYIKDQPPNLQTFYNDPRLNTHSHFHSTFSHIKQLNFPSQAKTKNYQKKRSLSMRTEVQFNTILSPNKVHAKTLYNNKKINSKARQNLISRFSNLDEKTKLRTVQDFKINLQRHNNTNFSQHKHSLSQNKILTQPSEHSNRDHFQQLVTDYQCEMNSIAEQPGIDIQTVKKNIFQKISLYVQTLDQKGEQQLNQMLMNSQKRKVKCHTDKVLYEQKIKNMIRTNKDIVKILKDQFLSPRKVKAFSQRNVQVNLNSVEKTMRSEQTITLQKKEAKDEPNTNPDPTTRKFDLSQSNTKPLQSSQGFSSHIDKTKQPQDNTSDNASDPEQDYNTEMNHVTSEFVNEWQRSKLHKKEIYKKFRKTLFKKFPEFKQRQIRKNKQLNLEPKQDSMKSFSQDEQQNQDLFDSKIHIEGLNQIKNKLKTLKINQFHSKINQQTHNKNKNISTFPNSQAKQIKLLKTSSANQKDEVSPLKQTTNQLSKSLSKISLLSRRNSISKGSTKTLTIFTAEDKKQVDKYNFEKLMDFIFKRAFFYSVSKKKIIQTKTECTPIEIVSPVQKKRPQFSFITYNSKAEQKKYIRHSKLNIKKLRATGNFLVKNKYNIMQMQQQGNKSHDFLRKCLEDAIQDYINISKKK